MAVAYFHTHRFAVFHLDIPPRGVHRVGVGEAMSDDDTVDIDNVECIRQTEKALLCRIGKREVWIPQSQVHDDSEVYANGHRGKLTVTAWFAEQEGLD